MHVLAGWNVKIDAFPFYLIDPGWTGDEWKFTQNVLSLRDNVHGRRGLFVCESGAITNAYAVSFGT